MDGHPGAVAAVAVTSELMVTGSKQQTLLWALPDGLVPLGRIAAFEGDLMEVAVDAEAGLMVGVGSKGLRLWDIEAGVELPGWSLDGNPRDVELDASGRRALVTLDDRDHAVIVDLITGAQTEIPATRQMSGLFLDDDTVVLAGSDGQVQALSLPDGRVRWTHPAEQGAARWDLAHDAERGLLYAPAFHHHRVDVFDPGNGAVLRTLDTESSSYTLRVDPHTGRLATGTAARLGLVFQADGRRAAQLEPHDGPVLGQAFSPDGTLLATADYAGPMRIFDLADGGRLLRTDRVQAGPQVRIWWATPRRLVTVSDESALLRDLDLPARLLAGGGLLGDGSTVDPSELAEVLALHGLHRHAAPLRDQAGAPALARARTWWLAGDRGRAQAALTQAVGSGPLLAGWRRLVAGPAVQPTKDAGQADPGP
jgi:hypothetical protein